MFYKVRFQFEWFFFGSGYWKINFLLKFSDYIISFKKKFFPTESSQAKYLGFLWLNCKNFCWSCGMQIIVDQFFREGSVKADSFNTLWNFNLNLSESTATQDLELPYFPNTQSWSFLKTNLQNVFTPTVCYPSLPIVSRCRLFSITPVFV